MDNVQTWQTVSVSAEETLKLAKSLAAKLQGGEVIELISDLGGGKTTFVRGLADGLGSKDHVHSPSFTIANEYAGRLTIYHLDLYRLDSTGLMAEEIAEFLDDPRGVVIVEWPGLVEGLLPEKRLTIEIEPLNENSRKLKFTYPDGLAYLIEKND